MRFLDVLYVLFGAYVTIGVFHSIAFHFFISPNACAAAKALVAIYCNTGVGIGHLVVTLGWPFYWL
jgi:hypothetical protein